MHQIHQSCCRIFAQTGRQCHHLFAYRLQFLRKFALLALSGELPVGVQNGFHTVLGKTAHILPCFAKQTLLLGHRRHPQHIYIIVLCRNAPNARSSPLKMLKFCYRFRRKALPVKTVTVLHNIRTKRYKLCLITAFGVSCHGDVFPMIRLCPTTKEFQRLHLLCAGI